MLLIRQILKKIKKKAFINEPFNLSRSLKLAAPNSTLPIQPIQTEVPNPADLFLSQQSKQTASTYESTLRGYMIDYIKANKDKDKVDSIDSRVLNNIQEREVFKELAFSFIGRYNAPQLYSFLYKVDPSLVQEVESPVAQVPILAPEDLNVDYENLNVAYEMAANSPINNMDRWIKRHISGVFELTKASDLRKDSIAYALGPPVQAGWIDQRINFFVKNPELIPKIVKDEWIESGSDSLFSLSQEDEGSRYLLLRELYKLIQEGNSKVDMHVWGMIHNIPKNILRQEGRAVSIDPTGETGEDEGRLLDTLDKDKMPIKERIEEESPIAKKEADKVIGIFVQKYIEKVTPDLQQLISGVVTGLRKELPENKNKEKKEKNKAERLEVYFDGVFKQIQELLKVEGKTIKEKEEKKRRFTNAVGSLEVKERIVQSIFRYVGQKIAEDTPERALPEISQNSLGTLTPEQWEGYIEKYLNDYNINWQPDWSKLFSYSGVIERFQDVGKLKQKILDFNKAGYKDANVIIAKMGSELDLYSTDDERKRHFIDLTLGQGLKGVKDDGKLQKSIIKFMEKNPFADSNDVIRRFRKRLLKYNKHFSEQEMRDFIILSMNSTVEEIDEMAKEDKEDKRYVEEEFKRWTKAGNPDLREVRLRGNLQKRIIEFKEGQDIIDFKRIRSKKVGLSLSDIEAVGMKFEILL
ncbi:hypothetical protein LCGC14_2006630, partial [marine sediment metagenome]